MAITEESRHRLYQRLGEVLGEEQATTLMEHLPPVGWADVATKRDLDVLRTELRLEFAAFREEMRVELHKSLQRMTVGMFASMISFAGILVGASHLA